MGKLVRSVIPLRGSRRASVAWVALFAACLSACGGGEPEAPPVADPATRVNLAQGEAIGFRSPDHAAHVWRGLPFAKPPVGELRWRAPQAPEGWEGTHEALEFGPECKQFSPTAPSELVGDEDCLTLAVYAPVAAAEPEAKKRPVMVWIHGGGNSIGGATMYDASRLAAENDVVVVVIQYRLGVLGWFAHPALRASAANADDASGNFGTLDTIRALEWVQENVAAFGGDAGNVTVFGESAGGINAYALLLSERSAGLFHRVIAQSPVLQTFTRAQSEHYADAEDPGLDSSSREVLLAQLQRDGRAGSRAEAKQVLDAMDDAAVEAYLRGLDADALLGVFDARAMGGMYFAPFVIRDGHVIANEDPFEVLARREGRVVVPVVAGSNFEETKLFSMAGSPHVRTLFGTPIGVRNPRLFDLGGEYGGLIWRARNVDSVATALRRAQPDVWTYRFDWDEEGSILWIDLGELLGASHAIEMLFVFGFTDFGRWTDNVFADPESAEALSVQMRSYWTEFARIGDPGRGVGGDLPEWVAWNPSPEAPKRMVFDSAADGGLRMETGALDVPGVFDAVASDSRFENAEERCEVYRSFADWTDELTPDSYAELLGGACSSFPLMERPSPFVGEGA